MRLAAPSSLPQIPGSVRATAVALAASGMDVGITWHTDRAGADATAAEVRDHGQAAIIARLDTAAFDNCGKVIDELTDRLGGVDLFGTARAPARTLWH